MIDISKRDKRLFIDKSISWEQIVKRRAVFVKNYNHEILYIKNKRIWSWMWLMAKLHSMDSTRKDIVREVMNSNKKLMKEKDDRQSRDIASMFTETTINI